MADCRWEDTGLHSNNQVFLFWKQMCCALSGLFDFSNSYLFYILGSHCLIHYCYTNTSNAYQVEQWSWRFWCNTLASNINTLKNKPISFTLERILTVVFLWTKLDWFVCLFAFFLFKILINSYLPPHTSIEVMFFSLPRLPLTHF